jgi:hypothetical protein
MSAPSSRPPVPRPTVRKSAPPAPPAVVAAEAYAQTPPVIRDRIPTLELEEDDLVSEEQEEAPPVSQVRSTPPPPPPIRSTVVPKGRAVEVPKIAPLPLPNIANIATVAAVPESGPQLQQPRPAPVAAAVPAPVALHAIDEIRPKLESMLDPSEALFDGMYDLNYAESHWQAARLCATALGRALGARTVIVHAHDLATHELRAIGVHGDGEFDLLGTADHSEDDLVASAAICNQKPVTMRFDGELPRLAPQRLSLVGAPRTLVAVPVMAWGRCVALIEIIDADERYASRVADSAAYVAERLAAFLSDRVAA